MYVRLQVSTRSYQWSDTLGVPNWAGTCIAVVHISNHGTNRTWEMPVGGLTKLHGFTMSFWLASDEDIWSRYQIVRIFRVHTYTHTQEWNGLIAELLVLLPNPLWICRSMIKASCILEHTLMKGLLMDAILLMPKLCYFSRMYPIEMASKVEVICRCSDVSLIGFGRQAMDTKGTSLYSRCHTRIRLSVLYMQLPVLPRISQL